MKKRPWTPKYPRSPATTSTAMPNTYRDQNQYKGQCAKCGKTGHNIARCFKATDKEKQDFFNEVKANKAKFKSVKKVRYADDVKTDDGPKPKTD